MAERLGFTALGSGSGGNAFILHTDGAGLLVDAGFSRTELLARMSRAGIAPAMLQALLLTHEHGDHVSGARVLADQLGIPTYASRATGEELARTGRLGRIAIPFQPGAGFTVAGFEVLPFPVPHDALDPVGFRITMGTVTVGMATDIGHLSLLAQQRLRDCRLLVLESNHDVAMQLASERHLRHKRRVLGRHGHLSNDEALAGLAQLLGPNTRHLCLVHLSRECNCPELVWESARRRLAELGRDDIVLDIVAQNEPLPTIWLD